MAWVDRRARRQRLSGGDAVYPVALALALILGPTTPGLSALAIPTASLSQSVELDLGDADVRRIEGETYFRQGRLQAAIAAYQEALELYRRTNSRSGEAMALARLAQVYITLGDYDTALERLDRALTLHQALGDPGGMGEAMNLMGLAHRRRGSYDRALALHRQALELGTAAEASAVEAEAWHNLGAIAAHAGRYGEALDHYTQALVKRRQAGDAWGEGRTLHNLGNLYYRQGDYPQAMASYQQALALRQRIGDRLGAQRTLQAVGRVQQTQGQSDAALAAYGEALDILLQAGDRFSAGVILSNIGSLHEGQGDYSAALAAYQRSLAIARDIGDGQGIAAALDSLGGVEYRRSRYTAALGYYRRALRLHRRGGNAMNQGRTLTNLGGVYTQLGLYPRALYLLRQALTLHQGMGNRADVAYVLQGIGDVQLLQQQLGAAAATYSQAQAIAQAVNRPALTASLLNRLGGVYARQSRPDQAIVAYRQALAQRRALGDEAGEGATLNNLALTYLEQGQPEDAEPLLHQARALLSKVGDRSGEGSALANLGAVLEHRGQPQVAIAFYKAAVNVTESIRADLGSLSPLEQQTYLATVADLYRRLADLLLRQDRVLEAQRVADLLKVQELDDYLSTVRGNEQTAGGIDVLPAEEQLLADYAQLQERAIQIGEDLAQLQQAQLDSSLTPEQMERLTALTQQQRQLTRQFMDFTQRPEVVARVQQLSRTTQNRALGLNSLRQLSNNLAQLGPGSVLIYPLVLPDRIELILVTANSPPLRRTTPVSRVALNRAIAEFRSALEDPWSDAQAPAQQLYDWLIQPLARDLAQAQAQTLIYAPDDQLRYIPLAALHDGEQWLAERYRTTTITAASLTDFTAPPQADLRVFAGAFTQGRYQVQVGDRQLALDGLPYARQEVEIIAELVPDITTVFNQAFSRAAVVPRLNNYTTLHFATHAAFLPGRPDESFILLGSGDRITLRDVEMDWFLTHVDLVVLSACETGVGGTFGTGEEILGFGYLMQEAGARAAIASLWSVDDGGTQTLMAAFYQALGTGATKAEALRKAQLALIRGTGSAEDQQLGVTAGTPASSGALAHPYYWAPFILIGNGR